MVQINIDECNLKKIDYFKDIWGKNEKGQKCLLKRRKGNK